MVLVEETMGLGMGGYLNHRFTLSGDLTRYLQCGFSPAQAALPH